jgi:hypothetical protein
MRAQRSRRLDLLLRDVLERREDEQRCERDVDADERDHDREPREEDETQRLVDHADPLQRRVEDAVGPEDGSPCVDPHEVATQDRSDGEGQQDPLRPAGVDARLVGQEVAEHHRNGGHPETDHE